MTLLTFPVEPLKACHKDGSVALINLLSIPVSLAVNNSSQVKQQCFLIFILLISSDLFNSVSESLKSCGSKAGNIRIMIMARCLKLIWSITHLRFLYRLYHFVFLQCFTQMDEGAQNAE